MKSQKTSRTDSIWPEDWTRSSDKQRKNEIADWAQENATLQAARRKRGIYVVLTDDKD